MRQLVLSVAAVLGLAATATPAPAQAIIITSGATPPGFYSFSVPYSFQGLAVTNGAVTTFPVAPPNYAPFGFPVYRPVYGYGPQPFPGSFRPAPVVGVYPGRWPR